MRGELGEPHFSALLEGAQKLEVPLDDSPAYVAVFSLFEKYSAMTDKAECAGMSSD